MCIGSWNSLKQMMLSLAFLELLCYSYLHLMHFRGDQFRIHLECGRPGFDPWVGKIPWWRVLAWRNPMDKSLAGYSPQGRKESDTIKQLSTMLIFSFISQFPNKISFKNFPWHFFTHTKFFLNSS